MTELDPERLQEIVRRLLAGLADDAGFAGELARARREFTGGQGDAQAEPDASGDRFAEWFLLERDSERLGDVPIRVLDGVPDAARRALGDSRVGLFEVRAAGGGEVLARELQSNDDVTLYTPVPLATGDLVVGRLFAVGETGFAPSPAAVLMRSAGEVVGALRRDLAQLGLGRALSQAEIEALWFRRIGDVRATAERRVPPERLEARLESILREGGAEGDDVAAISAALRAATEGPGAVIGPLLDDLAFHSQVDLEQARTTLLSLWNEHRLREQENPAAPGPAPTPAPAATRPGLGRSLAERIESGLRDGEDIEDLFRSVEAMLGESIEDDDEQDGSDGERGSQGDLDALVTEFLWERGHQPDSAHAAVLRAFVSRQLELPVPGVWTESITGADLVRFLLRTYLASPPGLRAVRVRAEHGILDDFLSWVTTTQQYAMQLALQGCDDMLMAQLERVHRASVALSTANEPTPASGPVPGIHRVATVDGAEVELAEAAGGGSEPLWVTVGGAAAAELRPGDWILGPVHRAPGGAPRLDGLVLVLPAAVGPLLG